MTLVGESAYCLVITFMMLLTLFFNALWAYSTLYVESQKAIESKVLDEKDLYELLIPEPSTAKKSYEDLISLFYGFVIQIFAVVGFAFILIFDTYARYNTSIVGV